MLNFVEVAAPKIRVRHNHQPCHNQRMDLRPPDIGPDPVDRPVRVKREPESVRTALERSGDGHAWMCGERGRGGDGV